jgi:hypothetical protein
MVIARLLAIHAPVPPILAAVPAIFPAIPTVSAPIAPVFVTVPATLIRRDRCRLKPDK